MKFERAVGLGFLVFIVSYSLLAARYPFLMRARPGPGFMPYLLIAAGAAASLSLLLFPAAQSPDDMPGFGHLRPVGVALGKLALSVLIMMYLGYIVATIFLLASYWLVPLKQDGILLRASAVVIIPFGSHLLFNDLLDVSLPQILSGIWT